MNPQEQAKVFYNKFSTKEDAIFAVEQLIDLANNSGVENNCSKVYWEKVKTELQQL